MKRIAFLLLSIFVISCTSTDSIKEETKKEVPITLDLISTKYLLSNYQEVIIYAEKYTPKNKREEAAVIYLKAHSFYGLKQYLIAIEYFDKMLEYYPDNAEVLNNLGAAYFYNGDLKTALKYFNLSFLSDPLYSIAKQNYNITLSYFENKVDPKETVLHLLPFSDEVITQYSVGMFYFYLGDFPNSIFYFKKCIKTEPSYIMAYISLGYIYDLTKNYMEARVYLEKALIYEPNNPNLQNNLGILYFHINDVEKSIQCFKKAIELNNSYAYPYNNLGFIFIRKKDFIKSIECFQTADDLNKNEKELKAETKAGIALAKYYLNYFIEAKQMKENALFINPKLNDLNYLTEVLQWDTELINIWIKI